MLNQLAEEDFEERAAIIEYDGLKPRSIAESMALREVSQIYGTAAAKFVKGKIDERNGNS